MVDATGSNVHETGPAEWQKKIRELPVLKGEGPRAMDERYAETWPLDLSAHPRHVYLLTTDKRCGSEAVSTLRPSR